MNEQTVIFKADDIREHQHGLSPNWNRFVDLIVESDVTAALGLIGDSLESPSAQYVERVKQVAAEDRFEIWNHGYDHRLKKTRADGSVYSEFFNTSLEHQRAHLGDTQRLAEHHLNLTLTTFGAPGNHIDDNTLAAVDDIPELTVWLYGDPRTKKHNLVRTINVEHPTHYPDFDAFRDSYSEDIPLLTLQLHPGGWGDDRFRTFKQIVTFLKAHGCLFSNPAAVVAESSA